MLLKLISLTLLVSYHFASALPDTNIQIQHYDGPIFMGTPNPDCCPFCNSLLKSPPIGNVNPSQPALDIIYPQTTPFDITNKNEPITAFQNSNNDKNECGKTTNGKTYKLTVKSEIPVPNDVNQITGNTGPIMHTDTKEHSIHSIPVTCRNTYGSTYPETVNANAYAYNDYRTGSNTQSTTVPLSSYLPINTASQNTCYQVPTLTSSGQDEPVLVPQKFIYSLILDGDVKSNHNGYDYKYYYN